MEWQLALILIVGGVLFLVATGMPISVAFIVINVFWVILLWGGESGLRLLAMSMEKSVARFVLLPLPLFTLMGTVLFHSGIAPNMIDAVDKWLGRLPGRLGLEAVIGGALLSTLTGSDQGEVAILGSTLVPEMEKRGYKKPMSLGPILGSGGLAVMIPPSGLAVFLGALAAVSIGKLLIGIIVPGILMAIFYATYILIRCKLQPHIAPPYEVTNIALPEKVTAALRYILPVGFVIFMVIGLMLMGIATPTQAAGTGAFAAFIMAAFYKRLTWSMVRKATEEALRLVVMMMFVFVGAKAFSQVLASSGASRGLVEFIMTLPISPIFIIITMMGIVLVMGTFLNITSIMMITIPLFMPIVLQLGFNPVWFAVLYMINTEMATTTPPFGYSLFVMKAVAPPDTTMGDVYRAGLPFLGCDLIVMALVIIYPSVALWLPGIMR